MIGKKQLSKAQPIDKVEQAVAALHEFIVEGGLEPGTVLPSESEMVEQIGVSKFSMREALRVAQSQGLIEISQGKRTRVADVSTKPAAGIMSLLMKRSKHLLLELTEARRSLEISIVQLAAMRRTDEQVEEMEKTINDMEANQEDVSFCVDKDIQFHEIMTKATGNRVYEVIYESLGELLRESRQKTFQISGVDKPIYEHRQIVQAIKEKDRKKAVSCMSEHLDTAELSLKELRD
ncbi:MAG: FadR/GntR family transcriptional regulator [Desulfocapsaceae bacterium]